MAATINTNSMSLNAQRNLSMSQSSLATSVQRLSSGLRVNTSKDDAAGLAIADRMNAQAKGFDVAIRNANDGISMGQTADSAMQAITDNLQRMRELAVQSANGTYTSGDRTNLDAEFQQLNQEIARVVSGTQFNGQNILTFTASFTFQVGAGTASTDQISVTTAGSLASATFGTTTAGALSGSSISGSSSSGATAAISAIDAAIDSLNTSRATWGAVQNRFSSVVQTLSVASENAKSSRGRIMDADFAQETANMTRAQILQQAGTAMVAQANSMPNNVLSLLK
ncbi:MAG TPA: flagellin [Zoogloea sp.]|uniref:flagellin N-terminal helical domain-containing protein n=1 Tax=Zoogloea sp. TaxID=49181 RepID=UPI002C89881C|nr:flagellin [Zoogloea sp.]HMV17512.1 flagellin [Rhodocyclaceae bacterium]HMV62238.1 flagellin [Rhodocyclaceae bacterium]HMW50784.1 flagellin [Rhodocyclaceae bacterium]HMY48266.1 flagellin [Rhodocyclaceae bacterium]HMZ74954.1 flagellin [Rhodocyclaceae bacterium]